MNPLLGIYSVLVLSSFSRNIQCWRNKTGGLFFFTLSIHPVLSFTHARIFIPLQEVQKVKAERKRVLKCLNVFLSMIGELTNERVGRVVLTGAHPQPEVLNATLDSEKGNWF